MTMPVVEAASSPVVEEPKVKTLLQDVMILEDHARVILTGGIEKIISLDDFRNILNQALGTSEETQIEGFNMPSNVLYFAKSGSEMRVSCYYQARKTGIIYHDSKFEVMMPNIIISHKLRKAGDKTWQIEGSRYFCTDLTPGRLPKDFIYTVSSSMRIFLLPMTNTYAEGNMCYGNNSMPARFVDNNLRGLDWYYQYMFESSFNDDLGVKAIGESLTPRQWYQLLKETAQADKPFPYEKLRGYRAAQ